jgi:hypothetical protein
LAALLIGVLASILIQERASAGKPNNRAVVVPSAFDQPGTDEPAAFLSAGAPQADSGGKTDESSRKEKKPRDELNPEQLSPMAVRSMQKLKELVIATHNYYDIARCFPAPAICDERGKPLLSWRVHLLPALGEDWLYRQFHLDGPWDSEHNRKLIPSMPNVLRSPASKAAPGKTTYLLARGPDTVFSGDEAPTFSDIRDGSHNTIMIVETTDERAVTWTKPEDFVRDLQKPAEGLVGPHKDGILAAFFDTKVRMLPSTISEEALNALFTGSGREFVHSSRTRLITPRRLDAVAGLRRIGAKVQLNDDGDVTGLHFPAESTATDADLARLTSLPGLDRVETLGVYVQRFSGDSLKCILSLRLPNITTLNLSGSSVTDTSLALVKNMTTLRNLHVRRTQISDDGLAHVKELPNLEYLDVSSTKVTDAGLKHLSGLYRLRTLGVVKCRVTKAGIEEFKEALPDCRMIR